MTYTKRLPSSQDITWLSKLITTYPVTRSDAVRVARTWNFKNEVITFLRQFPPDKPFNSRSDLVNQCANLALVIREAWESPTEIAINS